VVDRAAGRGRLPPGFERWWLALGPGVERPTDRSEWAGAIVVIERGRLEVCCAAGGRATYEAGALLPLGWLPVLALRNPGAVETRLVAIRRRSVDRG
jgi:hypothetical protein